MRTLHALVFGALLTLPSATAAAAPQFSTNSVLNAASFQASLSPGCAFSIFGSNLSTATEAASATPLPNSLGGATLTVNGTPAPLFYASPTQINGQLPFQTPLGSATIVVTSAGLSSPPVVVQLTLAAPGVFTDASNHAVAQNQDGSTNSSLNPATGGSVVVVYFTGGGPVDNPVPTGSATPLTGAANLTSPLSIYLGATPVKVLFAGLAPGEVGINQLNIQLPLDLPSGSPALKLTVGGSVSNTPVISVR